MDRDDELEWALLARYFAGDCSAEERAVVARWVARSPERAAELRELGSWWEAAAALPPSDQVDAMWESLAARMRAADGAADTAAALGAAQERGRGAPVRSIADAPSRRRGPAIALGGQRVSGEVPRHRGRWRAAGALAAGLVLAAGAALAWRARDDVRARGLAAAHAPELREFVTARGQRATIRLEDGTRVELGYASRLRVGAFEPAGRREMYLEGEAVFEVVHDPTRPFVVHAGNAVTEDLGTVFGVRAYPGDSAVRVVVVSGEVALRPRVAAPDADRTGAVLGGGQLGRLDGRGRVEVESGADTAEYLGWLSGRVSFHDASLSEVAAELERRFDVTVTVADPALAARRVTVETPSGTLTQVLDAVTTPIALRHRRDAGGVVVISGR